MDSGFVGFYLTILIVSAMVAYAGVENTLMLFRFVDLSMRYQIILVRSYFMKRRLKKSLEKSIKEFKNDRKSDINLR